MPAKNSKKEAEKISEMSAPKAGPTSRPLITNSQPAGDPMVTGSSETDGAPPLSVHGRNIEPPKHDDTANDDSAGVDAGEKTDAANVSTVAGASPDQIIEGAKGRKSASTETTDGDDDSKGVKPVELAEAEKNDESVSKDTPTDALSGGASDTTEKDDSEEAKSDTDQEAKAAAAQAKAERLAKYDEMAESGKYFVPIGAVRRRHDRYWLIALVIILVIIIILDLLFDAGVLKISGFNFYTNFIGN